MAYIYKIVNDINDKIYIGKTLRTIEDRWKEHLSDINRKKYEKRPLYNAMRKYGTNHFYIKEIEQCDENIVNDRERYWIEEYGSFKYGYNATQGGDGKAYVDVQLILHLWAEGKNNREISKITGYDYQTISNHLDNNGILREERKNRGYRDSSKVVAKLDKQTEEIIEIFSSSGKAAASINKPSQHIREVCLGKRKTAYGYKWKYL